MTVSLAGFLPRPQPRLVENLNGAGGHGADRLGPSRSDSDSPRPSPARVPGRAPSPDKLKKSLIDLGMASCEVSKLSAERKDSLSKSEDSDCSSSEDELKRRKKNIDEERKAASTMFIAMVANNDPAVTEFEPNCGISSALELNLCFSDALLIQAQFYNRSNFRRHSFQQVCFAGLDVAQFAIALTINTVLKLLDLSSK